MGLVRPAAIGTSGLTRGSRRQSLSCRRRHDRKSLPSARPAARMRSLVHSCPVTGTQSVWPDSRTPPSIGRADEGMERRLVAAGVRHADRRDAQVPQPGSRQNRSAAGLNACFPYQSRRAFPAGQACAKQSSSERPAQLSVFRCPGESSEKVGIVTSKPRPVCVNHPIGPCHKAGRRRQGAA